MTSSKLRRYFHCAALALSLSLAMTPGASADPSKYPEFAQQTVPADVTPEFIRIEQLLADIKAGAKPLLVDVRSKEEFDEVRILGAQSAPLAEFKEYLKSMPCDRPIVLY